MKLESKTVNRSIPAAFTGHWTKPHHAASLPSFKWYHIYSRIPNSNILQLTILPPTSYHSDQITLLLQFLFSASFLFHSRQ